MLRSEVFRYRSQAVRDLVAILLGPPLVESWVGKHFHPSHFEVLGSSWGKDLYEKNRSRLEAMDQNPDIFETWVFENRKTKRLGYYFELLIAWVLKNLMGVKNLERSVQIKGQDGQTQGELDFWFETDSKPVHLEVAIKFYLETEAGFVGPDVVRSQDRLDNKWDRLRNLQSQILETPLGLAWLKQFGIQDANGVVKQILLKGHLFAHDEWGRVDELDRLCLRSASSTSAPMRRYEHLDRSRWLSPAVQALEAPSLWTLNELKSHACKNLLLDVRPWLIVEYEPETHAGVSAFFERRRFFMVPNGWTTG